jgi:hypothetical protein
MVIRRDSDGTTQSIGFVGEEIDESAIETFCTGTTCTVATWYDQSGNGNHATQPTPANQPTIYTGGQLVKEGGRLALDFDGTDDGFNLTSAVGTSTVKYAFITHLVDSTDSQWSLFNDGSSAVVPIAQSGNTSGAAFGFTITNFYKDGFALSVSNRDDVYNAYKGGANTLTTLDLGTTGFIQGLFNRTSFFMKGKGQEVILYTTDKSSVRTDIEGNISAYFQSAKLLDEQFGEDAEAAYSTRQLRRDQTDCMVIRRASDSTTTTIGFDANGDIDETAIETFCTGTTCTVVTWKDQSGNGNDATAASGKEAAIYTGGALVKDNGRLALDFTNDFYEIDETGLNIDEISSFVVGRFDNTGTTNQTMFALSDDTTNARYYAPFKAGSIHTFGYASSFNAVNLDYNTDRRLFTGIAGSTIGNFSGFENGVLQGTATRSSYAMSGVVGIGGMRNSNGLEGNIQEVIYYNADKSSDRTSIESNIGDYFTQNTPLLDTYSGAAAAYSLRKLNSSYTGAAIEVYAGTNGTADIGFNVFGELDTVALAAHCGNQDGTVQTWYDQSGNGNHATQGVAGNQPKIYDGATTSVVTENGKPAMYFDGSDDRMVPSSDINASPSNYEIFAVSNSVTDANSFFFDASSGRLVLDAQSIVLTGNGDAYWDGVNNIANKFTADIQSVKTWLLDSTNNNSAAVYENGSLYAGSLPYTQRAIAGITRIGNSSFDNRGWAGYLQELVFYATTASGNRTGIEDNINTFYSIY